MKSKKRFGKLAFAVLAMLSMTVSGCGESAPVGPSGPGEQTVEEQIESIYKLYVADAIANGQIPKSYQEWLDSIRGPAGEQGEPGKDGNSILHGSSDPYSGYGNVGDTYINTTTWDFFVKDEHGWNKYGCLKGADGGQGQPGKDGTSMITGNGAPSSELGKVGDSYVNLDNWDFYVKESESGWVQHGNIKGQDGDPGGPVGPTGNGIASIALDHSEGLVDVYKITYTNGEVTYFNVTNGEDGVDGINGTPGQDGHTPNIQIIDGYWFIDGVSTGIKAVGEDGKDGTDGAPGTPGQDGVNGADGTSLLTGSGAPNSELGKVGDSYIDIATWDFYVKTNEGWLASGNIKGQNGSPGQDGAPGQDGKDGTSFRNGQGAPADTLGINGDTYLDYLTYDLYIKENGHWIKVGNISSGGGTPTPVTTYNVNFDANGGSGSMSDVSTTNATYVLPECDFVAPLGEEFVAWTVNGTDYQPADPISLSDTNTTVYAKWAEIGYTIDMSVPAAHLYPGNTYELNISITPTVSLSEVTVTSSDPSVATIGSGKNSVTTLKAGVTTLVATYDIGTYHYQKSLALEVEEAPVVVNPTKVDFYAFNDQHGVIADSSYSLGIAKTTTLLKDLSEDQNAVFISQGDMWQGSCESNSNRGELMTRWMNELGFVSMTMGNHEYDWGSEAILANHNTAEFPFLGINIFNRGTGSRVSYADPSTIINVEGVKIGIIGAIGDCYSSIESSKVTDITFAVGSELSDLVKAESTRLREVEGCDFIVYSLHDGKATGSKPRTLEEYYDLSLSSEGYVDVVFEGHSHLSYRDLDDYGVYHIQGDSYNDDFNHVAFEIDPASDTYTLEVSPERYITKNYTSKVDDADVVNLLKQYDFSEYYDVIGTNDAERNSNALRNTIASLYLSKGLEEWGTSYDIVLGGGYLSCRRPYKLEVGNVNRAMLYNLFPFDNDITLCSISGYNLRTKFLTTRDNYFIALADGFDSSSVDDDATYYIVCDTYSANYSYNKLTTIASLSGIYARDLLAEYISNGGYGGGVEPTPVYEKGTVNNPYTADEAYEIATERSATSTNPVSGWFKSKVSSLGSTTIFPGYMSGAIFKDSDDSSHEMTAYKLYQYDGATQSENFLTVGDEVLFYGSTYIYESVPQFGGVNVAVKINDELTGSTDPEYPASIAQLKMQNEVGGVSSYQYFEGSLYAFSYQESLGLYYLAISSRKVNNGYTPYSEGFYASLTSEQIESLKDGAKVTIKPKASAVGYEVYDVIDIVAVKGASIDYPLTVAEALELATANGSSSSGKTGVYCKGVVTQAGNRIGYSGDIGNIYIGDKDGDVVTAQILIYFLKKNQVASAENGQNFTSVDELPVGTEVIVYGVPFNYNNTTKEFASGTYCVTIGNKPTMYQSIETAGDYSAVINYVQSFGNVTYNYDWNTTYLKDRGYGYGYNEEAGKYALYLLDRYSTYVDNVVGINGLADGVEVNDNDIVVIRLSSDGTIIEFDEIVASDPSTEQYQIDLAFTNVDAGVDVLFVVDLAYNNTDEQYRYFRSYISVNEGYVLTLKVDAVMTIIPSVGYADESDKYLDYVTLNEDGTISFVSAFNGYVYAIFDVSTGAIASIVIHALS